MRILVTSFALAASASLASAVTILTPGDAIIGGARVGSNFEVGVVGTAGGVNNWPGAEVPADLINGFIGGDGEKYLNFARLDTGFIVTPTSGASVARQMELWVANDAPERDPASYEIWGANGFAGGAGPFDIGTIFAPIASGALALPEARDGNPTDMTGNSQVVNFANNTAYETYLILFPTVRGPGGNSMQISEVQLDTIPEPSAGLLALLATAPFLLRRRRK